MSKGGFRFNTTENPNFNDVRSGYAKGSDPDFLYYNAQIINNSTDTTSKVEDPRISFQDTRTMALLQDKSNYGVSVENFTINGAGKNLPLFVPQIREFNSDGSKNTNPDNTIYDITFTWQYGGTKESPSAAYQSTRSIQWVPENQASWQTKPLPLGQYFYPQPEIPYYYCYSYSHWIKLVNSALACAWQDVKLSATTGGVAGTTIIINSLSGSKVTLDNVSGTFVVGALINQVETDITSVAIIDQVSPVFVISVLEGTFNVGDSFIQDPDFPQQKPDVSLASATIVTLVPSTFTVGGTVQDLETGSLGKVISFQGNTLVLYETTGDFNPGDTIFEDVPVMDTGSAKITSVSTSSIVVPPIEFGTKCPFFTYDSKTNLFSLWQDANTCVTPYGSSVSSGTFGPSNPPNPLNVFGASTASGYQTGEYSFIGYNTNFESLLTNFDTTYYSDQIAYPSQGFLGVEIQSPIGNELCEDLTGVNVEYGNISAFTTDQMTVTWTSTLNVPASNWSFATPSLISSASKTLAIGDNVWFDLDSPTTVNYIKLGTSLTTTASNSKSAVGYVTDIDSNASFRLQITSISASPCTGSGWTLTLTPNTSTTTVTPSTGIPVSLSSSLYPTQSPLEAGFLVNVTGPEGQSFSGSISSYEETLGYTDASGVIGSYINYTDSSLANGFNPVLTYQPQNGVFDVGDIIEGQTSKALGQIIDVVSGNSENPNTITIDTQSGPFVVGTTITSESATATITGINGTNEKDVTTLSYSSQKNPFVIGHTIDCYASLNSLETILGSADIVDIVGDNLGYGTMNFTNQNCKFGVGETIVDNDSGAVATIVQVQGDNNGYGYVSYINQLTTGAPGAFVPDEFLLLDGVAFAKVVIDNQNVLNPTEGNIGNVTVITGEEIAGIFYVTSNIPLPFAGQQIQGSESGTLADYGGIAYKDTGVLILNNICGTFGVGDLIVDSIGYGLPETKSTSQATAICNGMAYLTNGKLILKNVTGTFPTNSFIIDGETSGTTNPIVVEVNQIPVGEQFYQGKSVSVTGGYSATIISNNGPTPYGNNDNTTQVLTILPKSNSLKWDDTLIGDTIIDDTQGLFLTVRFAATNTAFYPGDYIVQGDASGTVETVIPSFPLYPQTIRLGNVNGTFTTTQPIYNYVSDPPTPRGLIIVQPTFISRVTFTNPPPVYGYNSSHSPTNTIIDYGQQVYNWDKDTYSTCLWSSTKIRIAYSAYNIFNIGDIVQGSISQVYGKVIAKITNDSAYTYYLGLAIETYNGILIPNEKLINITNPLISSTATIQSPIQFYITASSGNGSDVANFVISDTNYDSGDSIAGIPFNYIPQEMIASGANITLSSNVSLFEVGSTIYLQGYRSPYIKITGKVISIDNLTLNVSFKEYINLNSPNDSQVGFVVGALCSNTWPIPISHDTIATINYWSPGYRTTIAINNYYPSAGITNVSESSPTIGNISSVTSSSSNAFVQTFKTSEPTTLTVDNITNTFTPGNSITDDVNTATIKSVSFSNGSLIVKPLFKTFDVGESIKDLSSNATANFLSLTPQTIQGPTGSGSATVLADNGSQLSITGATGTFSIGNTITSELGVTGTIDGFPLFGVGNIVTQLGPTGAAGIIVSDNGSQLVVKNVVGPFVTGSTISSVGATGTVSSVSNPVLNIIPLNSTDESSSWTIVPTPLTSSSTVEPDTSSTFTTNLTFEQTIYNVGDTLEVTEANPVFTVEQLYLPENVVQVDLSSGNTSKQTLQSVFPSTETGSVYAVLVQDYESTSSLWSPVASIVIGTQFITVREEYSGTPITIGNGNLGSNTTASSFQKVLLETPLELLPQTEWRGLLNYTPQVEALSSLGLSKEELKNLDFQIYWRNRLTNSLTPLTLYNGGSANIRLLFKRIHE